MKTAFVRQRKTRGVKRAKAKRYYRTHKTKIRQKAKVWRRRNKNRIKMTRRRYSRNPAAHRRIASPDSNIVFSFRGNDVTGIIVDITDMGVVKFIMDSVFQSEEPCCLPITVFVDLAVFDDVADVQSFFDWADAVLEQEDAEQEDAELEDAELEDA